MNIPTWGEMIASVKDKDEKNRFIPSSLYEEFGINEFNVSVEKEQDALDTGKFYSIPYTEWLCTDTKVGLYVYFLDDIPVCASWQRGRKCAPNYYFFNVVAYEMVKNLLNSFVEEPYQYVTFVNVNDKMPDFSA